MRPIGSRSTIPFLVLVLFAGIFPYFSSAQSPNFTQYKVDDGLPSSVVYGSFEDREGFIWFATEFGVSRFDGYEFTNYTTDDGLSDNVIFDFFEDSQGRIWFYTYNGVPCYFQNGKIVSYSDRPELSKSSKREMISTILEGRDGTIWVGRKLSSVLGITRSDSLFHQPIEHILEAINSQVTPVAPIWSADSSVYLITGSSVIKLNESTNQWAYYVDSLPVQFFAPIFSAAIPQGLVIAKKEKLYRVMVQDKEIVIDSLTETPNGLRSTCIVQTRPDEFYVGTIRGVFRYQLSTNTWGEALLEGHSITSVCRDREDNYWFTSESNGVYYTPAISVKHWADEEGFLGNNINRLLVEPDGKTLWAAMTNDRIVRFRNGEVTPYTVRFPFSKEYQGGLDLAWNQDQLIVASTYGVSHIDPKANRQKHLVMPGSLKSILLTESGKLLYCGGLGVLPLDRKTEEYLFRLPNYPQEPGSVIFTDEFKSLFMFDQRAYSLLELENGELLAGTAKGLVRINGKDHERLFEDHPSMGYTIYSMAKGHDGSIWAATHGGGLVALKGDSLLHFDVEDGLNSNLCKVVFSEPNGTIWVGSNQGVSCLHPSAEAPKGYAIKTFSTLDGLTSDEVNDLIILNDTLWLASPKGLSCIPLKVIDRTSPAPKIFFTSVSLNNQPITLENDLVLAHDENNLDLKFIGLSYQSKQNLTYHHRLLGADETWKTTTNTNVEFLSLNPGTYTFEVYVTNFKGNRSEETLRLKFTIRPPWWQQWWAIGLGLTLLILVIYLVVNRRYRVAQVRDQLKMEAARSEQKALRARIAPHFIYNALNSVQSLISENRRIEALNYTSRFSLLMRKIFEHSLENYISLEEEIETLGIYLKLEQLRFKDKFSYEITIDPELDPSMDAIPSMILQPIIENSIWHGLMHRSEPGHVSAAFHHHRDHLQCVIEDNGIGREAARKYRSKFTGKKRNSGLAVTRERLETLSRLEGKDNDIKMEITDLKDQDGKAAGTRVEVWLPLKQMERNSENGATT